MHRTANRCCTQANTPETPGRRLTTAGDNEARALPNRQVGALVGCTPLPIPGDGLYVTVCCDEPRAVIEAAFHRLAGKESVTPQSFADAPLVACAGMAALRTGFSRLDPSPDGRPGCDRSDAHPAHRGSIRALAAARHKPVVAIRGACRSVPLTVNTTALQSLIAVSTRF